MATSEVSAGMRETTLVAPDATARHWSLEPAARPGSEVPAPPAARAWCTRARLGHLDAWRTSLQQLSHYDPDYLYDPGYEYESDWTTDPDYRVDGVRRYGYNGEGFLSPTGSFHNPFMVLMLWSLCEALGHRVAREPDLYFSTSISETLDWRTEEGHLRYMVSPDLAVMPPSWTLPEPRERTSDERIIRLDAGDPSPEMLVEILSPSTGYVDLGDKMALYAALGVAEYLLVEPGDHLRDSNMWLFRLHPEDGYLPAGDGSQPFVDACGVSLRLHRPDLKDTPVLQWLDTATGRWRYYEDDLKREGATEANLRFLDRILPDLSPSDRQRIEAHWLQTGVPDDVADRILDAGQRPDAWQAILRIPVMGEGDIVQEFN